MQPTGHLLTMGKRACLANKDQEGSLESVLGCMSIPNDTPADSQHHRSMPLHQRRERSFLSATNVALDELSVSRFWAIG